MFRGGREAASLKPSMSRILLEDSDCSGESQGRERLSHERKTDRMRERDRKPEKQRGNEMKRERDRQKESERHR